MKYIICTIFLLIIHSISYCQTIKIISRYPQYVPKGKKWVLTLKSSPLIEVVSDALNDGNICNATLNLNPQTNLRAASTIVEGEYPRPNKFYSVQFEKLYKVHHTNERTYQIGEIKKFICSDLIGNSQDKKSITFYAGQTVVTFGCLESIEVTEFNLSNEELRGIKLMKDIAIKKASKQSKEYENRTRQSQREEKIERIKSGMAFDESYLFNKPRLKCIDTSELKKLILNCLFNTSEKFERHNLTIVYDKNLKPIKIASDVNCEKSELIERLYKICTLDTCGVVELDGKILPVSIEKYISFSQSVKYSLTKQQVDIRRKRNGYKITMRDANSFVGYEYEDINQHRFNDTSYVQKIRDCILNSKTDSLRHMYYAKRCNYRIQVYIDGAEYFFNHVVWDIYNEETHKAVKPIGDAKYVYNIKNDVQEKWDDFFNNFKKAVELKDITRIKKLTAADFFDGGGGETLEEWLKSTVYKDGKSYNLFMKELAGNIKKRVLDDGSIDRVTGNGETGHLYFIYENSEWKFGGVIGD